MLIRPRLWITPSGYAAHHPYVRRFWTGAIGAGPVADLLRLMRAAEKSQSIRRPTNTSALARCGLVIADGADLWVRSRVPPVPAELLRRLTPALRHELTMLQQTSFEAGREAS